MAIIAGIAEVSGINSKTEREMSKKLELLKKIQELAKRGVDGEAVNAQELLSDLLKKYNLTLEDLESSDIADRYMKVNKDDVRILHQIVGNVNYSIEMYVLPASKVKLLGLSGNVIITCTSAEFIEIEQKFEVYSALYKKELDIFFSAFCTANDLLVDAPENDTLDKISAEDIDKWLRIDEMSKSIKRESVVKRLNN